MIDKKSPVVNYFEKWESRLGYRLVIYGAKHFGYYPDGQPGIGERKAQENLHQLLIEKGAIKNGQRVLDAGCGEGVVAADVAKKTGAYVEGVTIVPFEVKRAQDLARSENVTDKTHFQVMDYTELSFPDDYFDAVYTVETLVHAYDLKRTLKELYRVLKPGGIMVNFEYSIAHDDLANQYPKERKIFDWVIEKSAMTALRQMHHEQFRELLEQVGFTDVEEENLTRNILPSMMRLYQLAKWPYKIIHLLHLEEHFINTTTAAIFFPLVQTTDLFHYNLYTSNKPANIRFP